jgi:hypothetical protein
VLDADVEPHPCSGGGDVEADEPAGDELEATMALGLAVRSEGARYSREEERHLSPAGTLAAKGRRPTPGWGRARRWRRRRRLGRRGRCASHRSRGPGARRRRRRPRPCIRAEAGAVGVGGADGEQQVRRQ